MTGPLVGLKDTSQLSSKAGLLNTLQIVTQKWHMSNLKD